MINWETLKISECKDFVHSSVKEKAFSIMLFIVFLVSVFGLYYCHNIMPSENKNTMMFSLELLFFIVCFPSSFSLIGIYYLTNKVFFYDISFELNLSKNDDLEKLLSNKGFLLNKIDTKFEGDALVVNLTSELIDYKFRNLFEFCYFKTQDGKTYFIGRIPKDKFYEFTICDVWDYEIEKEFKDKFEMNLKHIFEKFHEMKSMDELLLNNRSVGAL